MRRQAITGWLLLTLAGVPAGAGVEVVLEDGRIVEGASVERKDDRYMLELADGAGTMTLPADLVREIRLSGDSTVGGTAGTEPVTGEELEPDPSAVRPVETGRPPSSRSPANAEQLAAFGRDPASFRKSPVDTRWRYEEVLGATTDVTEFRPSRWYEPPVAPTWTPVEAFEETSPVPRFNPVRWYRPPVRATWYPRDGWDSTVWFPPVVSSRER